MKALGRNIAKERSARAKGQTRAIGPFMLAAIPLVLGGYLYAGLSIAQCAALYAAYCLVATPFVYRRLHAAGARPGEVARLWGFQMAIAPVIIPFMGSVLAEPGSFFDPGLSAGDYGLALCAAAGLVAATSAVGWLTLRTLGLEPDDAPGTAVEARRRRENGWMGVVWLLWLGFVAAGFLAGRTGLLDAVEAVVLYAALCIAATPLVDRLLRQDPRTTARDVVAVWGGVCGVVPILIYALLSFASTLVWVWPSDMGLLARNRFSGLADSLSGFLGANVGGLAAVASAGLSLTALIAAAAWLSRRLTTVRA